MNKINKTDYKDYYRADINKTFTHKEAQNNLSKEEVLALNYY